MEALDRSRQAMPPPEAVIPKGSDLDLMMLGAAKGDSIDIIVTGDNAEAVLADLAAMVEDGFGEP